jgi:hypothetical protein
MRKTGVKGERIVGRDREERKEVDTEGEGDTVRVEGRGVGEDSKRQ